MEIHSIKAEVSDDYPDQFDDVLEFIQDTIKRLRRSSNKQSLSRRDRGRIAATTDTQNSSKKTSKDSRKRRNKGCVLREIHLNVTDLGLGYEAKEELKFRYCSGSCNNPETTYDQILKNLTIKKKLVNDKVKQACCRPIAFDDDVSFLDDNLVYHTLRQHSAKKCGCV
ncbi:glial cell line-derived neurotrophic factor isoform X2 [Hyla sarda]|uniref:glial cell line-derived neurotrophic factor isoform X2 n=1 Tax=Hyla sarda TaxID=327740 RepID=UPI0024C395C0|nr:glial cell line-derived neurotrophic factor isoform X2 [Hyla sarda]